MLRLVTQWSLIKGECEGRVFPATHGRRCIAQAMACMCMVCVWWQRIYIPVRHDMGQRQGVLLVVHYCAVTGVQYAVTGFQYGRCIALARRCG